MGDALSYLMTAKKNEKRKIVRSQMSHRVGEIESNHTTHNLMLRAQSNSNPSPKSSLCARCSTGLAAPAWLKAAALQLRGSA